MKVLHLIPDLEYGNAARQLGWLAPALKDYDIECHIAVFSSPGPLTNSLANLPLTYLDWDRWVDLRPLWRLRRLISDVGPGVIHCWRVETVRALALVNYQSKIPVIVSSFSWPSTLSRIWNFIDRWLFRRVDRIVVQWPEQIEKRKSWGVPQEKLLQIPPGVRPCINPSGHGSDIDLPAKARVVLCVGPLEASKGIKDAVWAFHILGFLFADLYLILVGEGPEHERLDRLAAGLFPERMIALGSMVDYGGILARADVVWAPSLKPRGFNVVLEAMAAGKPVVASRLPGLTEIVQDSETGFLYPVGDKVSLAKKTRLILDDPNRRRQMGEAGGRRVQERFSVDSLARAHVRLYQSLMQTSQRRGDSICQNNR
jgi:glycosyltransferase involved in cell wall biosynthesis